jgi:hypothetical protein
MQAQTHSPAAIFGHDVRYVVPLFQRPYVWTLAEQWEPLWDDVRQVAERLLDAPQAMYGSPSIPPHFLGAIVLEQQMNPAGFIGVRHIVDGQQRLTTLQILLDAAQLVVAQHGEPRDAQALKVLVLNEPSITQHRDEVFKVWPTDRDQDAFRAAMDDDADVPAGLSTARIVQAHQYFADAIVEWADPTGDPEKLRLRLNALVRALRDHLKMVVIDLEPGDNAQVIFETLNHRGSPLLAADLVKNLLFQLAQAQHADVTSLYRRYWQDLDGDYWRQLVAQGRLFRPRIDLFLNHWLTMRLLREIPTDRIYAEFRELVVREQPPIESLLAELAADAEVYRTIEQMPESSVEGRFYYRVVRALDSAAVSPFLLWLLRRANDAIPVDQRHRALCAVESWMVRRALCRMTSKALNQLVVELLRHLDGHDAALAGAQVEAFLADQTADTRLWPDDAMLHSALDDTPIYKGITRPRLRMLLEAIEDDLRTPLGEPERCPRGLTVEHVMPQAWREHWGSDVGDDEVAALRRDRRVQTLGNLTLVTGKLNPSLSNRPWTNVEAEQRALGTSGKRAGLLEHSTLKLNARLVADHGSAWTEDDIRARTKELVDRIARIWPRPLEPALSSRLDAPAVDEEVADAEAVDEDSNEDSVHSGKYHRLWSWLRDQTADEVNLSFANVEDILDMALPPSSRSHEAHWYGYDGTAVGRAIRDAGWKATTVNLTGERVTFVRVT